MNTKLLIPALLLCSAMLSAESINLKVTNPNKVEVKNAPVVLSLDNYKDIPVGKRADLAVYINGKQVSSQLDDLNNDGIADELVFMLDMQGGQTCPFTIKTILPAQRDSFPTEVYADLITKAKKGPKVFVRGVSSTKNDMYNAMFHHGVAFESALIAYRIYFDNKSTVDVYGKKKQQLELAKTGWYPNDEQLAEGYGDDVIQVFDLVGVGTVKGWNGTKATHIDQFDKRTQRIVSTGKLRTVVESEVEGWQYEGKKINMTVRYIMYARHRDVLAEVRASEDINFLATGVQQTGGGTTSSDNKGLVGSWGTYFPVTDTVKYAKQTVGLGVRVPVKSVIKHVTVGANNLVLMPYHKGKILKFYLTAASRKEEKNPFTTSAEFFSYLSSWGKEVDLKPLSVHK
jgi:hypothetical protein